MNVPVHITVITTVTIVTVVTAVRFGMESIVVQVIS